ncbi:MAG: metallophosphoesterase [Clostridia bacterium]|nr:metallophosphoesterase [Clostridia bacterium]
MKRSYKFIAFILSIVLTFGFMLNSFAAIDITTADAIRFDKNGNLRVMHVTDNHLGTDNVAETVWLIGEACDREQPDIVVITGDNVDNTGDKETTKYLIDELMDVFEARDIPVAVTFGNHDSENENGFTREELMAYYNTFSCSVSVDDGVALPGCGTYNVPVLASDSNKVKFNLWVFDSGDYDEEGHYASVLEEQVNWYKAKSALLAVQNGGEPVYSLVFQHIIVGEIYDALKKADGKPIFSFEHLYNDGEYYMFDESAVNYGTLNETPCPGYLNHGQFDAMVGRGDVLAMFTGHDHTNAFGVRYKGIDIVNSLSTRYNGDAFSTQYGYRIIDVKESDTSTYSTRVVHWYEMFELGDVFAVSSRGDGFGTSLVAKVLFLGFLEETFEIRLGRGFAQLFSGRQISYAD